MLHVQEATYTRCPDGAEMRATSQLGRQDLTTHWPVSDRDDILWPLLAPMIPTVQDVTFRSASDGGEITITLAISNRSFQCSLPIDEGDEELKPALDRLLQEIGRELATTLQSSLSEAPPRQRDVKG